jgi:hypothetical protein
MLANHFANKSVSTMLNSSKTAVKWNILGRGHGESSRQEAGAASRMQKTEILLWERLSSRDLAI